MPENHKVSWAPLLLVLSWRNLWRHPLRTSLTVLTIAFATAVLMFFVSLQDSSYEASINATIAVFTGDLQLQRKGYLDKPQIHRTISDAAALKKEIAKVDGVEQVTSRAFGFALVTTSERSFGSSIVGVEPESEKYLSTVTNSIKEGRYFSSNTANEAIVGRKLAQNLKLKPGGEITFLGQGKDGSVAASILEVVGIYETGADELDRQMVQMPLGTFQDVFSMGEDVHAIVIKTMEDADLNTIQANLTELIQQKQIPDIIVLRWDEILSGLLQAIELDMAAGGIFYFFLIAIVAFSILNTFLMSVMERTHEFGVILSLGFKHLQICKMILVEMSFMAILGLVIGMVTGGAVIIYYGIQGFSVPGAEEIMKLWNLPYSLKLKFSDRTLISGPAIVLIATVAAIFYPLFKISTLKPVEALSSKK
jgi:ABC-type lipoprotein release transport system permease subunit